jgi:hypothetical protein
MKLSVLFTTFLLSVSCFAATSIFDEADRKFYQNRFIFEANYRYFQSEANYTQDGGQYVSLSSGSKYQSSDFDLGLRWVTGRTWGLYTSTRISQAESKYLGVTRKNTYASQVVAGVDMLLISNSKFDLIPDVSLTFPLQRVNKTSDEVIASEGALELMARMIARLKWGSLEPFASAGLTYRDEGRSTLLPFSAGAEFSLSSIKIGADIGGYQTILKDQYTSNSSERHSILYRDGGSLKYYSVDPSLLETSAWLRWQAANFGLKIGAATTMTGANSAAGTSFFAGLNFALDSSQRRKRSEPARLEPESSSDDEVQKFEETVNDGVDQNLFRKEPPPAPKPKPVKKPDPAQQRLKMQQELDQTEFQIELKKTSKKKRKK